MSKTILFIDDDLEGRMSSYKDELEINGYSVLSATTPAQALEDVQNNKEKIDIVILDIMMPHGSELDVRKTDLGRRAGVELFSQIRMQLPETPIVILTVVRDRELKAKLQRSGAAKYLTKPILASSLIREIVQIIDP